MAYKELWKANNVEKHKEHSRRSMEKWRNNKRNKMKIQATQLRIRYNLSVGRYMEIFIAQKGVCAICSFPETAIQKNGKVQRLAIDHDHRCCPGKRSCGRCLRGLLCGKCNVALGLLREDITRMEAMVSYVKKTRN